MNVVDADYQTALAKSRKQVKIAAKMAEIAKEKRRQAAAARRLAKANAAFNALPVAKKRVAIAKDVIAQLRAEKFSAKKGNYVYLLSKNEDTCQVCALGACAMSTLRKQGTLSSGPVKQALETGEINDDVYLEKLVVGVWSRKQLDLMESAFEGYVNLLSPYAMSEALNRRVEAFYLTYPDATDRLIAIMKNVIANDGTFVPPALPKSASVRKGKQTKKVDARAAMR